MRESGARNRFGFVTRRRPMCVRTTRSTTHRCGALGTGGSSHPASRAATGQHRLTQQCQQQHPCEQALVIGNHGTPFPPCMRTRNTAHPDVLSDLLPACRNDNLASFEEIEPTAPVRSIQSLNSAEAAKEWSVRNDDPWLVYSLDRSTSITRSRVHCCMFFR